jgi:beta-fructofuranosidase
MDARPVRVAFLHAGELTAEQQAAVAWCREALSVDPVSFDAVAADGLDPAAHDVAWWHRDDPREADGVAAAGDGVRAFVADGGGLLLSQQALRGVVPLGVDDVPPDDVGVYGAADPVGFYVKRLFEDHPAFEGTGLTERRLRTCPPGERAYACYRDVLPAAGDVLACALHGDEPDVGRKTMFAWSIGDGHVVGVGDGLGFRERSDVALAHDHDLLARNLLTVLGGERYPSASDRPADAEGVGRLRTRLAGDSHRPAYHISPPAGWLNDPNGLIHWNGSYHVFYQYNPGGPMHDTIHWGHAVSDDLVHWRDEPVALAPSPDGPDRDGCWSGCAVDDGGTVRILYTGGRGRDQLPCLATAADPALRSWEKYDGNPVIESPPADLDVLSTEHWRAEFRDHSVWRADGVWYHVVGSGVAGVGGAALLYRGERLTDWEYVGPLLVGDWDGAGRMWECPELLDFGETQLLHVSNHDEVQYYLGEADYAAPSFEREASGLLDYGDFYAPQSMLDDEGRYLTVGWIPEARELDAQWEAGWSGALSLPRHLDLGPDGDLRQRPAPELKTLRTERLLDHHGTLSPDDPRCLTCRGSRYEVRAEVDLEPGATFDLVVRESPARTERTVVRYDGEAVVVDRSDASLDPRTEREPQRVPVDDGPLSLRAFVDGSVLELFANDRRCLTSRLYPTRDDAEGLTVGTTGGDARVDVEVWALSAAWPTPPGR